MTTITSLLLASGIFRYRHGGYFRDKLILQMISRLVSNFKNNQVTFVSSSHQYEIFHYYLYLKVRHLVSTTEFSTFTHVVDHLYTALPFDIKAVTDHKTGSRISAPAACESGFMRGLHHHHHVVLVSQTLSHHFSLSFIPSGRSSGQHPVSSHSCWMYVRAGRPAFARPCVGGP